MAYPLLSRYLREWTALKVWLLASQLASVCFDFLHTTAALSTHPPHLCWILSVHAGLRAAAAAALKALADAGRSTVLFEDPFPEEEEPAGETQHTRIWHASDGVDDADHKTITIPLPITPCCFFASWRPRAARLRQSAAKQCHSHCKSDTWLSQGSWLAKSIS